MKYSDFKTFKDVCKAEGLNYTLTLIRLFLISLLSTKKDRKSNVAHAKLLIIVRAANRLANDGKEWIPDYDNYDETKYEPVFDLSYGGLRFVVFGGWRSGTVCCSRLCFIRREVCIYIAKTFISDYKDMMTHG